MSNVKIYNCLVSSPSDVSKEREICDDVFKRINQNFGKNFGFRVEALKWENIRSGFSSEPQAVINEQLIQNKKINLFIGIMWHRFGTPTTKYSSGTEEEFYAVYELYEKFKNDVSLWIYFNEEKLSFSQIDTEQLNKVKDFKKIISELGGLYKNYDGEGKFREILYDDLCSYFNDEFKMNKHTNNNQQTNVLPSIELSIILEQLQNNLNESLSIYGEKSCNWINRRVYHIKEGNKPFEHKDEFNIQELISKPYSAFINSPPRFGLTCLAHYMILEAKKNGNNWIYFDAQKEIRSQVDIEKHITQQCTNLHFDINSLECIVVDGWFEELVGAKKMIVNLTTIFSETPIIIMATDNELSAGKNMGFDRKFSHVGLLPLRRKEIREIVTTYNSNKYINEDNVVLNKITFDLENLNIHRTPEHCLTLLKIFEKYSEETPINRTKMISMILTVLFDFSKIPTYSSKPDVEHCEFLLGYFCEKMLRTQTYDFGKQEFYDESREFIKKNKIDLDIDTVFSILYDNRIVISYGSKFRFRHTFWIYFFCAKRMNQDAEFFDFIMSDFTYASFVEIIEFYTGINRSDNNMIDTLISDMKSNINSIEEELGIEVMIEPLKLLRRKEKNSVEIEENLKKIKEEVLKSKLSTNIKDEFADKSYDITRANNQEIHEILNNHKFLLLNKQISVCCRSLRNSEFIAPDKKTLLLETVLRAWETSSKIIILLSPILAKKGIASYSGVGYILGPENWGESFQDRLINIWTNIPSNISTKYEEDLHSDRLSTIISEKFASSDNMITNHLLIQFLISKKTKGWEKIIQSYIHSIHKNSFYFSNVLDCLLYSYKYDWATEKQLQDIKNLVYIWGAKEKSNNKHYMDDLNKIEFNFPKRFED